MSILIQVVFLVLAFGIVFWVISKVPIPEPINYVIYGLMAIGALLLLGRLFGAL